MRGFEEPVMSARYRPVPRAGVSTKHLKWKYIFPIGVMEAQETLKLLASGRNGDRELMVTIV